MKNKIVVATIAALLLRGVAIAQINESDTLRLQTRLAATAIWQDGNVKMLSLRSKLDICYALNQKIVLKTQNTYLYQEFFDRVADEDFSSRNFVYLSPQRKFYPFAMAFVSKNLRREINLRYFTGAGATYQLLNSPNQHLKVSVSAVYEFNKFKKNIYNKAEYNGSFTIRTWRATAWLWGKHYWLNNKLIFHYECFVQPSLENARNMRYQTDIGVEMPLYKNLNFLANFLYTYESVVTQSQKQHDRIVTFGLSYQLKK